MTTQPQWRPNRRRSSKIDSWSWAKEKFLGREIRCTVWGIRPWIGKRRLLGIIDSLGGLFPFLTKPQEQWRVQARSAKVIALSVSWSREKGCNHWITKWRRSMLDKKCIEWVSFRKSLPRVWAITTEKRRRRRGIHWLTLVPVLSVN